MVGIMEIMQLCRLCLVKEQVNIPIFEDQGDIRQIYLKITACLPVKVSKEDKLPKKICDGCLYKLELLYQFWNSTASAEKQLLSWIKDSDMEVNSTMQEELASQSQLQEHTVKQEKVEPAENTNESVELSTDAQSYILQQQQLSYQPDYPFKESQGSNAESVDLSENLDEPISKRRRRRQATKPIPPESLDSSENEATDSFLEMTVTKTEEESESNGDENIDDSEAVTFPAVSVEDTEQPGPSGLGKGSTDAPLTFKNFGQLAIFLPSAELDEEYITSINPPGFQKITDKSINCIENIKITIGKDTKKSTREENTVCSECGKLIKYKHYDKHIKCHKYKCKSCPETFGTERAFEAHCKVHSNDLFTCAICSINFASAVAFSIHNQKHSGFGVYKCPLCPFETATKTSMKPHIKLMHMKEYKRVCEICGKGFLNNATYTDHMTVHSGEKKFICEFCDKRFVLGRYLDIHKKLNHKDIINGVEEFYACHICNRTFKFEKSLIRHLSCIHNIGTSKKVACPVCNKIIANNYGLKIHMRTHSGEKPYSCEICNAKFARTKYLQKHMMKHTK